jgi:zinc transporter, ZIP family
MNVIIEWIQQFSPVNQALIGTCFTWAMTALGAAAVFLSHKPSRKMQDGMLGFAAGVMIAASYWSLLAPAIEMSGGSWMPAAVGFLLGGVFLRGIDMILPHLHVYEAEPEGMHSKWKRSIMLVTAITLHNFPEGLAVGVAFGAAAVGVSEGGSAYTVAGAVALAIGIGIQNLPEGLAVSMPLQRTGLSRRKSFMYGQFSGMVEPIAGVLGAMAVIMARPILPYALAFAAGAMIFVVVEDAIPEAQSEGNNDIATMGAMIGFTVMMVLDVALG